MHGVQRVGCVGGIGVHVWVWVCGCEGGSVIEGL